MANWVYVFTYRPELEQWVTEAGTTDVPAGPSDPVPVALLRQAILRAGWTFSETAGGDDSKEVARFSSARRADGASPPFTSIDVWPDFFSVRHGGYACWVLAVVAAAACGPQVAMHDSGTEPVVCTEAMTYEQWGRAFGYEADVVADAAWYLPPG